MARIKGHNIRPFLKYYEPVSYNRDELFKDHLRSKRATNQEQIPIQLQIFGYNRKYELSLRRDKSVFTDDFKVLSDDTFVPMDISFVYSGKLKASELEWPDKALIPVFWRGLADHVKDALATRKIPATLEEPIAVSTRIDFRFNERRLERAQCRQRLRLAPSFAIPLESLVQASEPHEAMEVS
ncbi:unnamed protein product [Ranitomeya imitator]|uniref:VTC domain-containing protein n=1 Tax=Ranitomeya imitator TaxID=111125 RepID=A0ABN9L4L3_9NEOB|nr:unnamed protein product [Ranitomeya imitator]